MWMTLGLTSFATVRNVRESVSRSATSAASSRPSASRAWSRSSAVRFAARRSSPCGASFLGRLASTSSARSRLGVESVAAQAVTAKMPIVQAIGPHLLVPFRR